MFHNPIGAFRRKADCIYEEMGEIYEVSEQKYAVHLYCSWNCLFLHDYLCISLFDREADGLRKVVCCAMAFFHQTYGKHNYRIHHFWIGYI